MEGGWSPKALVPPPAPADACSQGFVVQVRLLLLSPRQPGRPHKSAPCGVRDVIESLRQTGRAERPETLS